MKLDPDARRLPCPVCGLKPGVERWIAMGILLLLLGGSGTFMVWLFALLFSVLPS
jgi:hypothetical protein